MKINCDYSPYGGCGNCKFQKVCSLTQPTTKNLESIRKEINFKLKEVDNLNNSVIIMKSNIKAIQQGLVNMISVEECENILIQYQSHKHNLISEIRELRRREKNILKVIQRRIKNEKFQDNRE